MGAVRQQWENAATAHGFDYGSYSGSDAVSPGSSRNDIKSCVCNALGFMRGDCAFCDGAGRAGARNLQFEPVREPLARVVSLLRVEARDTLESARKCGE
jgi:hypothetical protein